MLKQIADFINRLTKLPINENAIYTLKPYYYKGTWVFDDHKTGLVKEPFIEGIPEIIEEGLKLHKLPITKARKGFTLIFSKNVLPTYKMVLKRSTRAHGGVYYKYGEMKGWLCPALFKYFNEAPKKIFVLMMP